MSPTDRTTPHRAAAHDAVVQRPRVGVFSASWARAPHGEMATAVRSIAGALSRLALVDVVVPGAGPPLADGAFEAVPAGSSPDATWPDAQHATVSPGSYGAALVDAGDPGARALASAFVPHGPVLAVGRAGSDEGPLLAVGLPPEGGGRGERDAAAVQHVGLYARVDAAAGRRRHYGLRSIPDYLVVLGDRTGTPSSPWPSAQVRWMLARFPRRHIAVLEAGVARVWRSRSCVARFEVHTRMDLWMVLAHATGVVDLLPGEVFARECVESLRLGVPIAAPEGSSAEELVRRAGGAVFSSTRQLLGCVELLHDPSAREALARQCSAAVDRWYGDPDGLVDRLAGAVLQS